MKRITLSALLLLGASWTASANTLLIVGSQTCYSDEHGGENGIGLVVPCSTLEYVSNNFNYGQGVSDLTPQVSVSGNTFTFADGGDFETIGNKFPDDTEVSHSESFDAHFDVTYTLSPPTPVGDIYKLTGSFFKLFNQDFITVEGNVGVVLSTPTNDYVGGASAPEGCPGTNNGCSDYDNYIIPGDGVTTISAYFNAGGGTNPLSEFDGGGVVQGGFTLSRFQADGVTPDPFVPTPEPSSWILLGLGFLPLAFRRNRSSSHE